jgi:hypothetical protein
MRRQKERKRKQACSRPEIEKRELFFGDIGI